MMTTDPIADMLTRIRNAYAVKKADVVVPTSVLKRTLANIFVAEGYITKVEEVDEATMLAESAGTSKRAARRGRSKMLRLVLKYGPDGTPAARHLSRVSKPSLRIYVTKDKVPVVRSGLGITVLSTSQGIMTNRQAKQKGVGGEILCTVY